MLSSFIAELTIVQLFIFPTVFHEFVNKHQTFFYYNPLFIFEEFILKTFHLLLFIQNLFFSFPIINLAVCCLFPTLPNDFHMIDK
jgi:hypothetical protein